jgi:hypothetical protein
MNPREHRPHSDQEVLKSMKTLIHSCNPAFKSIFGDPDESQMYSGLSTKLFDLYQFKHLFASNYRIYDSTIKVK